MYLESLIWKWLYKSTRWYKNLYWQFNYKKDRRLKKKKKKGFKIEDYYNSDNNDNNNDKTMTL